MLGDAISHAILPGIFFAYWFTGSRASLPMIFGAAAMGLFCVLAIDYLQTRLRMQNDAAIGLSFTFLFAVGVILISAFSGQVDLDQECVLYGDIVFVPLNTWQTAAGVNLGPVDTWLAFGLFLLVASLIAFGFKGLQITSFDPEFAAANGINTKFWNIVLLTCVSVVAVVSFQSVGAILVVAFMVVPAATAKLCTNALKTMLWLSMGFGLMASIVGYGLASQLNASVAGAIVTISGIIFCIVLALNQLKIIGQVKN